MIKQTKEEKQLDQNNEVIAALKDYLQESRANAREWQDKARKSWDMLHGRVDWSHKTKDQSKVHMNRVGLAQEQIKAQVKQGLMNFSDWLIVEPTMDYDPQTTLFNPDNAKRLVNRLIDETDPKSKLTDNIGIACVENMLATKLRPIIKTYKGPKGKKIEELHVEHVTLNIRNYYPDATMSGLYEFHEVEMDHYKVLEMSTDDDLSLDQPYVKSVVETLNKTSQAASGTSDVRVEKTYEDKDRGNDTTIIQNKRRRVHVLHEFWGTVLDTDGSIMEYEMRDGTKKTLQNVILTMANESVLIDEPRDFPSWAGESDFVVMQLLRNNLNMYGKSLLAPGVDMNKAEDELLNAGIDAAKKEAYNVNTLKLHGLAKKEQASGGLRYGMTLLQNNQLAPGEKLIDTVSTGKVPPGLLQILTTVQGAGTQSMRMNDISLSGKLGTKQTRATEVVAADQTIQGLFESIVSDIEDMYVEKYAKKVFNMGLQNFKLLSDQDLAYIFYGNPDKIAAAKSMSEKDIFEDSAYCFKFRGKGIRSISQQGRVAQTIMQIMTMMASNPIVNDQLERSGLSLSKMLEDAIRGQGLDYSKYIDQQTAKFAQSRQLIRENALAQQEVQQQIPQGQNQGQQQGAPQQAPQAQAPGAVNAPAPSGQDPNMAQGNGSGY